MCSLALAAGGGYWWYQTREAGVASVAATYKTVEENDVYVRFDMEAFDIIMREYWQKASEPDLAELYRLALQKTEGTTTATLLIPDRAGTARMLADAFARTAEDKRKGLARDMLIVVMANLAPQGRMGLLSEKEEQAFRDVANNVDRSKDLYQTLGVEANAPIEKVQQAFAEKKQELEKLGTPEAKQQLAEAEHAHQVLSDEQTKVVYDQTKIEPTIVSHLVGDEVLYLDLSKISPATFNEFFTTLERTNDQPKLTGMIIDLRGNIGGSLDFAKYLLALFIGPQQYAFDLFHQGELKPERTPAIAQLGGLKRFKEIALLTDGMTQSTAEVTAAMFKRLHMGKVVGTKTRGWGTVENTFPMETHFNDGEKYKLLIVHGMTLREDNELVEGRGVDPDVDISDPKWKTHLKDAFRSPALIKAIVSEVEKKH